MFSVVTLYLRYAGFMVVILGIGRTIIPLCGVTDRLEH